MASQPDAPAPHPIDPELANAAEEFHDEIFENLTEAQRLRYQVVIDSLKGEEYLSNSLNKAAGTQHGSFGERLADKVAEFGGSWTFIGWFGAILVGWMVLNAVVLANRAFDPYPFILLNLVLSCLAAIQAPVIMMSQNRKEQRDRRRAEDDYLTNLKAEIEIRTLQQKVEHLLKTQRKLVQTTQAEERQMLAALQTSLDTLRDTVGGLCRHMNVPPEAIAQVEQAIEQARKAD